MLYSLLIKVLKLLLSKYSTLPKEVSRLKAKLGLVRPQFSQEGMSQKK